MGTSYHITLFNRTPINSSNELRLSKQVSGLLQVINRRMSTYRDDSQISQFNRSTSLKWFSVSADFIHVVKVAQSISKNTHGAFDITVSPLVEAWGFAKKTIMQPPSSEQLNQIKKTIGYKKLSFRENPPALKKHNKKLQIDLSAIAKGFAVDKLSDYLISQNYKNFMVEIGGEIKVKGHAKDGEKWRIVIRNPHLNEKNIKGKKLLLSDIAVATSGNYLNYFIKDNVRYSHILDPRTAQPKTQPAMSVTVLHNSTMRADAYATAMMVLGEEEGQRLADKLGLEVHWSK